MAASATMHHSRNGSTPVCSTCKGTGLNPYTGNSSLCPMCEGSGNQYDPGREFTYEMGPFTLNAAAAASPTFPQYFVGAASANAILNGVTCQVTGNRFRWMFAIAKFTFDFSVQIKDAGSGTGRSFVPQQLQVHCRNLFGSAEHPMPLPTPYVFDRNVQITADFTDLVGAVGTCGVTNGSPTVTWTTGTNTGGGNYGNGFNTAAPPNYNNGQTQNPAWNGNTININGVLYVISAVTSQNSLTLATNYAGANNANIAFAVSNSIRVAFKGVELSS